MLVLLKLDIDLSRKFETKYLSSVKKCLNIKMMELKDYRSVEKDHIIYDITDTEFNVYYEKSTQLFNELKLPRQKAFTQLLPWIQNNSFTTLNILKFLYLFSPTITSDDMKILLKASTKPGGNYYQERTKAAMPPPKIIPITSVQDTVWTHKQTGNINYYGNGNTQFCIYSTDSSNPSSPNVPFPQLPSCSPYTPVIPQYTPYSQPTPIPYNPPPQQIHLNMVNRNRSNAEGNLYN